MSKVLTPLLLPYSPIADSDATACEVIEIKQLLKVLLCTNRYINIYCMNIGRGCSVRTICGRKMTEICHIWKPSYFLQEVKNKMKDIHCLSSFGTLLYFENVNK